MVADEILEWRDPVVLELGTGMYAPTRRRSARPMCRVSELRLPVLVGSVS